MKKTSMIIAAFACVSCLLLVQFMQCANPNAGNGSDTGNAMIASMLYNHDGTPAKHATVRFYKFGTDPRTAAAAVDSTTTDANGNYTIALDSGTYNILASGGGNLAYQDSITAINDSIINPPTDTLKAPGGLRGLIRLQPGDDARTVFILFLGTHTWGTPDDPTGKFGVANMAEGTYQVRILTTLDAYLPKDTILSVATGKVDTLTHDIVLPYKGIPVPIGLKITYDTLKQIVTLSWNKPTIGRTVAGYNVYRKEQDSTSFVKIKSGVTDTVFADSTLKDNGAYEYRVTAVDTQNSEGIQSAGVEVVFNNRLRLATSTPAFGPERQFHSSVVFNNKMWVIAGEGNNNARMNDVWSSTNGIDWTLETASASFPKRARQASVVFNGQMWVIGGYDGDLKNDVWSSSDGVTWTQATDSAGFSPRSGHSCVVYDSKIWVIGGSSTSIPRLNDVWYSSDGISWNQATNSAGFSARVGSIALTFQNKIWLIGGNDGDGPTNYKNDVWSSVDGILWTQVNVSASFPGRANFSAVATDSTMWIFSGYTSKIIYSTDAWYSSDGINWTQLQTPPEYEGRFGHTSVVYDNKIWIIGQISGENASDVWYLN